MKASFDFKVCLNIPVCGDDLWNKYTMASFTEFCEDLGEYIKTRPFVESVAVTNEVTHE